MKLEQGERLESTYKDFITQNISAYEQLWGKFIGHDGRGRMIVVPNLPELEQEKRTNFSEYLYTCIESFICMKHICESDITVNLSEASQYISVLNSFIAFQA